VYVFQRSFARCFYKGDYLMAGRIAARLQELGITLPDAPKPVANYVPFVITGNLVFISGQVSAIGGDKYLGKVGSEVDINHAISAARACALAILGQLNAALEGDLDRVTRCVKLGGFVNCSADFDQQPAVINGASDLMVDVFGEVGAHARFAVGAPNLPFNFSVEIDAVFEFS
jgi:enamine deaminase RidA (YjgF/YER057c/UK114 family)